MNDNPFNSQPTHTPQRSHHPSLLPGQPPRQPAQLWGVVQHPQHSQGQAAPAPAYNPQWTVPPPPDQTVLGPQWQGPQLQYQQHRYYALPPVAQPPPHHQAGQSGYNPYQPTAGYHQHYVPASPQPQLPYDLHLQSQQRQRQQHLYTPPQHPIQTRRQRFDDPNSNRQVQHHPPPSPLTQNQGSGHGDAGRLNNMQPNSNAGGAGGKYRGMNGSGGSVRGGSMSGNRGGIASRGSSRMGLSGGNFGGAASMQAGGHNQFPNIGEPATVPMATQFEGAKAFTISGHPIMTNIGVNTGINNVTTVNQYGGTHGLEKLERFVSFAALYNSSEQDPDRRCHPGTRENILNRIRYWIDNPNTTDHILWLYGPAGAGKSAIAQTIAHGYNQGEVAATFFFFRSDAGRNDGNRLFPTIAWQLALSIPTTKNLIVDTLGKIPHLPMTDVETQFEQLVARLFELTNNVASQMRHPTPVVIIDGVDECSDEQLQRRILTVIGNAVKDSRVPLRFLISSRPEALIEDTLNEFEEFAFRIDLATLDDSNRDIEKYLVDSFFHIASKQCLAPTWPGQAIIEEIVFKSSGNFILASTLIRHIGNEDYSAESQLDIVRQLKPLGSMSPFVLLDELYVEVLKQPRDQDFLKTFLALLVGRSSVRGSDLHEDDAVLMNVSKKELHIKLRRMRALLKFEPFIDVYHKSFLDFLEDSSRSGQYHVSKQDGLKQYLELIVNSIVRHVSTAIVESNRHETCGSSPKFKYIVGSYPPHIVLPVEDWQEALKPLLDLQDKLLKTSKPRQCWITLVMRELLLQLAILQRTSHNIAAAPAPESSNSETVTTWSPALVTEAMQNRPEKRLDRCLSGLLACFQKTNSVLTVDAAIIERTSSLLAFDPAETAARVQSVTNAQKLIDIVVLLANNEYFLSQCGRNAARKACLLASEIFSRVPVLPQSLFLNGPTQQRDWFEEETLNLYAIEYICSSALMSRILDHTYTLPTWFIYQGDGFTLVSGNNEQNESVDKWLTRASPNFVTRIRVMLEIARTIRYLHSIDAVTALNSAVIKSRFLALDSDFHVKIVLRGVFAWQIKEKPFRGSESLSSHKSNISAFGDLFHEVCFHRDNGNSPNHLVDDAKQLIERCSAKSQPTMENVVKEMETWNLN